MEKKENRPRAGWLERTAGKFSLPLDLDAQLPHLELNGPRELLLLHHRGIRTYGETCMIINVPGGGLRIKGEGLVLAAMDAQELLIRGTVFSVEFLFN